MPSQIDCLRESYFDFQISEFHFDPRFFSWFPKYGSQSLGISWKSQNSNSDIFHGNPKIQIQTYFYGYSSILVLRFHDFFREHQIKIWVYILTCCRLHRIRIYMLGVAVVPLLVPPVLWCSNYHHILLPRYVLQRDRAHRWSFPAWISLAKRKLALCCTATGLTSSSSWSAI